MMQLGQYGGKYALSAGLGLLALGACASDESPGSASVDPECVDFAPSDPITLDANVRVVASGQDPIRGETPLTPALIADDSGVYWYDIDGFVFAQHRGEAEVVQLLQGVEGIEHVEGIEIDDIGPAQRVLSMTTDADRVFVTDGYLSNGTDFSIGDFKPHSRLLSIPKQGGPATVLLDLEDKTLRVLAADGSRLIVMAVADDVRYYQVSLAEPRLEPLPLQAPFYSSRVSGGSVYWTENLSLLQSGFDDAEPRRIARLHNDEFGVGPGYFLSEDRLLVTTRLFLQSEGASCARVLPRLQPFTSYGAALDPEYVYYYASPIYEGSTDDSTLSGELVRADVRSGALARLNTPGVTLKPSGTILGHDSENLYVKNGDTLLAIEKP